MRYRLLSRFSSIPSQTICCYLFSYSKYINTLRPGQHGRLFGRRHFQIQIRPWRYFNFVSNFTEPFFLLRVQLIISRRWFKWWTNDVRVKWCIYASPGLNHLTWYIMGNFYEQRIFTPNAFQCQLKPMVIAMPFLAVLFDICTLTLMIDICTEYIDIHPNESLSME